MSTYFIDAPEEDALIAGAEGWEHTEWRVIKRERNTVLTDSRNLARDLPHPADRKKLLAANCGWELDSVRSAGRSIGCGDFTDRSPLTGQSSTRPSDSGSFQI